MKYFVFILITAAVSCTVMRKIEPENRWYPIYAFGIAALTGLYFLQE